MPEIAPLQELAAVVVSVARPPPLTRSAALWIAAALMLSPAPVAPVIAPAPSVTLPLFDRLTSPVTPAPVRFTRPEEALEVVNVEPPATCTP